MRDISLAIISMEGAKLFILTENQEKADAILRGRKPRLHRDALLVPTSGPAPPPAVHAADMAASGWRNRIGVLYRQRHEALAAVRLVNKGGELIWATTQQSLGVRFRSASCQRGGQNYRLLKEDSERARKLK
jgi:hypothetical protein